MWVWNYANRIPSAAGLRMPCNELHTGNRLYRTEPTMSTIAKTLPGRYYTDPKIFQQELETFFCQMWFCGLRAEQIPNSGDYQLCEVAGESIIVIRENGGALRAFYNVCRHRGT